jgi:Rod binding domain-containing protein
MEIPALQHHVKAADLSLDKLARNSQVPESDKIAEVSRQFEAVLLRQILSAAQKTVFASSANPNSASAEIYRDMLTTQLADTISHSKALGLANSLSHELNHQLKLDKAKETPAAS